MDEIPPRSPEAEPSPRDPLRPPPSRGDIILAKTPRGPAVGGGTLALIAGVVVVLVAVVFRLVQEARAAVSAGQYETADQILGRIEKVNRKATVAALGYGYEECSES